MTATDTLHPELTADLVERVANLSPEAFGRLREIRDSEAKLEADYNAAVRTEILARIEAYERGEIKAVDGSEVLARLELKIEALKRAQTA